MTPAECESVFERIEEYKRSVGKYIQDIASLMDKINDGYVVQEDEIVEQQEEYEFVFEHEHEFVFEHEYEHHKETEIVNEYDYIENEDIFRFDEDEDLADFLAETFDF
jgi:hypothetical protein